MHVLLNDRNDKMNFFCFLWEPEFLVENSLSRQEVVIIAKSNHKQPLNFLWSALLFRDLKTGKKCQGGFLGDKKKNSILPNHRHAQVSI